MKLFIDTTNWKIIYLLIDGEKIVDLFVLDHALKSSDLAIEKLKAFLDQHQIELAQIQEFYLTTGPGSYTGIRVGMTIVKTIKTLNPAVKVYLINSLLYQVGLKKGISILDARGHKFYLGGYNQGKVVVAEQVVTEDQLPELITKYTNQGYEVFQDYQQLDYRQNFLSLQSHFQLATNVEEIAPLYIKNFI